MKSFGILSSTVSQTNFSGTKDGARHPLLEAACRGLPNTLINEKSKEISEYLYTLENTKIIKKGNNQLYQTDSLMYFPVFGDAAFNKYPLISPSKIRDANPDVPSNTRGGVYPALEFINQTGIDHSNGRIKINNPTNLLSSTVELLPLGPTKESILDWDNFFIAFYLDEGNVNGTYIKIHQGDSKYNTIFKIGPYRDFVFNETTWLYEESLLNQSKFQNNRVVVENSVGPITAGFKDVPWRAQWEKNYAEIKSKCSASVHGGAKECSLDDMKKYISNLFGTGEKQEWKYIDPYIRLASGDVDRHAYSLVDENTYGSDALWGKEPIPIEIPNQGKGLYVITYTNRKLVSELKMVVNVGVFFQKENSSGFGLRRINSDTKFRPFYGTFPRAESFLPENIDKLLTTVGSSENATNTVSFIRDNASTNVTLRYSAQAIQPYEDNIRIFKSLTGLPAYDFLVKLVETGLVRAEEDKIYSLKKAEELRKTKYADLTKYVYDEKNPNGTLAEEALKKDPYAWIYEDPKTGKKEDNFRLIHKIKFVKSLGGFHHGEVPLNAENYGASEILNFYQGKHCLVLAEELANTIDSIKNNMPPFRHMLDRIAGNEIFPYNKQTGPRIKDFPKELTVRNGAYDKSPTDPNKLILLPASEPAPTSVDDNDSFWLKTTLPNTNRAFSALELFEREKAEAAAKELISETYLEYGENPSDDILRFPPAPTRMGENFYNLNAPYGGIDPKNKDKFVQLWTRDNRFNYKNPWSNRTWTPNDYPSLSIFGKYNPYNNRSISSISLGAPRNVTYQKIYNGAGQIMFKPSEDIITRGEAQYYDGANGYWDFSFPVGTFDHFQRGRSIKSARKNLFIRRRANDFSYEISDRYYTYTDIGQSRGPAGEKNPPVAYVGLYSESRDGQIVDYDWFPDAPTKVSFFSDGVNFSKNAYKFMAVGTGLRFDNDDTGRVAQFMEATIKLIDNLT